MPTYAIGDVQGCYDPLLALLEKISFDSQKDELWFVGDLVNRGPKSLEVLRFLKNLKRIKVVLGNHDLHLLALAKGVSHSHHTLSAVLEAPDCDEIFTWLKQWPLLHYDASLNYVMVHAGIYPLWNLEEAIRYAKEFSDAMKNLPEAELITHLYGNQPDSWQENLTGYDRLRFIVNAFTRMRFCDAKGRLDLKFTGEMGSQPADYFPWFEFPDRPMKNIPIVFGHWAALRGKVNYPHVYALDTGCVWGDCLTAMRLEDQKRFSVPCEIKNPLP